MLLEQDVVQLKEWGNSSAFRIPQRVLKSLGFESNQEFTIKAVESIDVKEYRKNRKEERLAKYEGLT